LLVLQIEELKNQSQDSFEHTLTVEKKKRVKVKKQLKEIVSIKNNKVAGIKILWNEFDENKYLPYIAESGILLNPGQKAEYKKQLIKKSIQISNNYTFYEIVEIINRYTSLSCLTIKQILLKKNGTEKKVVKDINKKSGLISFLIETILQKAFEYKEKIEVIEEELELTKQYPFKISVLKNRNALVVYKREADTSRLGFHINPYNFDSQDEKELFASLREILETDEAIVDVYFTGGVTDTTHNDFYFDYFSPLNKRMSRYFPDFLIETTKGRFLAIEVKGNNQRLGYEKNKQEYKGDRKELFDEVFAKEVGFREFQKINENFEYHIIFDAGLQQQQKALYKQINSLN
ncbi:hypothetical protein KKB40_04680, partial [Patescibacteria group bacterium]|nr:hypothetical protein [Patescibacteria group bacterium]